MSIAETTREAVRRRPFLLEALRAGVLNYSAAAAFLDVDGDNDAVATALRRFREELPAFEPTERNARVTMQGGVGLQEVDAASSNGEDDNAAPLLAAGGTAVTDGGSLSAVLATGEVDTTALTGVCSRLAAEEVETHAAAVAGESLVVVVDRRDGAAAVRAVESALQRIPG